MLLLAVCALIVLSPLLVGRWPAGLLMHPWRWPILVWASLLLQVVIMQVAALHGIAPVLHILTYVAAGTFLWLNRAMPGALIVGVGALSNGVTIALNGGVLPARAGAVSAAGLDTGDEFANSAVVADPVLPWLGDVFAWPEPLPLANTFSVGDVVIVVGVSVAAWVGTRRIGAPAPEAKDRQQA
ncbi:DUF5317 family protein [Demequina sp. SO4-18]|uniref:DUF5317 family protein n=1 Tax=Demequina sp. SO4-18 TaxID=3401026 RepID=UPI003B5B534E